MFKRAYHGVLGLEGRSLWLSGHWKKRSRQLKAVYHPLPIQQWGRRGRHSRTNWSACDRLRWPHENLCRPPISSTQQGDLLRESTYLRDPPAVSQNIGRIMMAGPPEPVPNVDCESVSDTTGEGWWRRRAKSWWERCGHGYPHRTQSLWVPAWQTSPSWLSTESGGKHGWRHLWGRRHHQGIVGRWCGWMRAVDLNSNAPESDLYKIYKK